MSGKAVHIVQLPFPSQAAPHPAVAAYYQDYARIYARELPGYFLPEGGLWELPLWVAHLAGMLDALGQEARFIDLSTTASAPDACAAALLGRTRSGDHLLMSPLAQNLDLAVDVCRKLSAAGRRPILGGNMAPILSGDPDWRLHLGQATTASLARCLETGGEVVEGGGAAVDWKPAYRLLSHYRGAVPLLRLNASHGCLHNCQFCGDAWSRSLKVVPPEILDHEVGEFERRFPETRLIYIGDKTFGQSQEAVQNLLRTFSARPSFRFIVQTHVLSVKDALIDQMIQLGTVVVELGFESASAQLLRDNGKNHRSEGYFRDVVRRLADRGLHVVLNVLSGLPGETEADHDATCDFMSAAADDVWLFNLYNFVPYPMTPLFRQLRPRIVDWHFANWREDAPPVFTPYHGSRAESFDLFLAKVEVAHGIIAPRAGAGTAAPRAPGDLAIAS